MSRSPFSLFVCWNLNTRAGARAAIFFFFFLNVYLFLTERDRVQAGEGQRERETQILKQALGAELSAQVGLELMDHEIMT